MQMLLCVISVMGDEETSGSWLYCRSQKWRTVRLKLGSCYWWFYNTLLLIAWRAVVTSVGKEPILPAW